MWFQVLLVTVTLFVGLMLGALGGAAAFAKYGTRRKVLKWDAAEQLRIVPQQLSEIIGNPVVVHAGTGDVDELSLVVVGLIAAGNSVLEPVTVGITTNPGSEILGTRVVDATNGVCVTISCRNQTARQIEIATLRPGNRIIVNMVVRDYDHTGLVVNVAQSEIQLKYRWSLTFGFHLPPIARSVSYGFGFAKYDATARAMITLSEELRAIRQMLSQSDKAK